MKKTISWLLGLVVLLMQNGAILAAPIPGTSSSALVSSHKGLFRSSKGFLIHAGDTAWEHLDGPKGNPFIATMYRAPDVPPHGVQASLTLRVDDLDKKSRLQDYVKQWKRDYPRFGFDILDARNVKLKAGNGFLIDIVNKETEKQLRQVVFLKDATAVILTCRDHRDTFAQTVRACNEIIRNFRWL